MRLQLEELVCLVVGWAVATQEQTYLLYGKAFDLISFVAPQIQQNIHYN